MGKTAGIIIIGNEILSGKIRDENSTFFVRELRQLGSDVLKIAVIPDVLDSIAVEVRDFAARFDFVLTSGGVGPTHDDLTMAGVAAAFGRQLRRDPALETVLRNYYGERLAEASLRMADIPEGATLVGNDRMWFPVVSVGNVYIFPGVPEILRRKFTGIREVFRDVPYHLKEIFLRTDEGVIATTLDRITADFPDLLLGSYPYMDNNPLLVKLTLESRDPDYLNTAHLALIAALDTIGVRPVAR